MPCPDCEREQAGHRFFWYCWGDASIQLKGCKKHVMEAMRALDAQLKKEVD